MNRLALCAVAALGVLILRLHVASATEFRAVGGSGGFSYRVNCPSGSLMVGVTGFTGEWVDRLQVICAPMSNGALGPPKVAPEVLGDSRGGVPNSAQCAPGTAVYRVEPWFTAKRDASGKTAGFLDELRMNCKDVQSGIQNPGAAYSPNLLTGGTGGHNFSSFAQEPQICPEGEFAVGIHGNAGQFIDSLGIQCAPAIAGPGVGLGRAPRMSNTQRDLRAAGAGRAAASAGNARTALQPDIAAQADARQFDCGQPNSAVSQADDQLPGTSSRSVGVASPNLRNTRPVNMPGVPGAQLPSGSSSGAATPPMNGAGVGSARNRAPDGTPCANNVYKAAPVPPAQATPADHPAMPGASPGAADPRQRPPRDTQPGDKK